MDDDPEARESDHGASCPSSRPVLVSQEIPAVIRDCSGSDAFFNFVSVSSSVGVCSIAQSHRRSSHTRPEHDSNFEISSDRSEPFGSQTREEGVSTRGSSKIELLRILVRSTDQIPRHGRLATLSSSVKTSVFLLSDSNHSLSRIGRPAMGGYREN